MKRRVTLAEVAERAGVSTATVSYVLNETPNQSIPAKTRDKVLTAAESVGYTRSGAARTLARGLSDIVLLVVPDLPVGHVLIRTMEQLTAACRSAGLQLLARFTPPSEDLSRLCRELSPTAVILLVDDGANDLESVAALGIPLVAAWSSAAPGSTGPHSVSRMAAAGWAQAEMLAHDGHSQIGLVFPWDPRLRTLAQRRLGGATRYCQEHGLPLPIVLDEGPPGPESLGAWLDMGLTALCAYNDDVALAVLAAAHRAGVAIPGELSLIGVDNIPVGRYSEPRLSSVELLIDVVAARVMAAVARDAELSLPYDERADMPEVRVHRRDTTRLLNG